MKKPIPPHVIYAEIRESLRQCGAWQRRTTEAFKLLLPHLSPRHLPDEARALLVRAKLELSSGTLSLVTVRGLEPYFDAATREGLDEAQAVPGWFRQWENDRKRLRQKIRKARP